MLAKLGKWFRQWQYGRRRKFCAKHGHQIGPLLAGPRYGYKHVNYFDLFQQCPRCGLRAIIVRGVKYRLKAHRDLHNRFQETFRPPGRPPVAPQP